MEENGTYRWTPPEPPKSSEPPKPPKFPKEIKFPTIKPVAIVAIILTALIALGAGSCFYTVDDKQQAVVTTFGKVTDITDAGFHFKLPFGIQQVEKVDVNVYQHIELGYRTSTNETILDEASMITGDYNIVNVDFFVEYKISDPVRYL